MHAENFVVNQRGDGHAVENVLEFLPDTNAVAAFALVIEAVDSVNLAALVVASEQKEVLLELDLVREQQDDRLE